MRAVLVSLPTLYFKEGLRQLAIYVLAEYVSGRILHTNEMIIQKMARLTFGTRVLSKTDTHRWKCLLLILLGSLEWSLLYTLFHLRLVKDCALYVHMNPGLSTFIACQLLALD